MLLSVVSRFSYSVFFLLLFLPISSQANQADEKNTPSFDCLEAKTYAERLICNDDTLARIDQMQKKMYKNLLQSLTEDVHLDKLRQEQTRWEQIRNEQCKNTYTCLQVYSQHFIELKRQVDALPLSGDDLISFIQQQLEHTNRSYEQRSQYPTLDTEWPKIGLRGFYMNTTLTLEILERLSGMPVYKKGGPHNAGRWNFDATERFGHYNPEFIFWVKSKVLEASRETPLRLPAQRLYKDSLRTTARTFYFVYQYLYQIEQQTHFGIIVDNYQERLVDKTLKVGGDKNYPYCEFQTLGQHFKTLGYSSDEAKVAAAFWIRRFIDGTDKIFFATLENLFRYFDAEFLKANQKNDDIVRFYDTELDETRIKEEKESTVKDAAKDTAKSTKAEPKTDTHVDTDAQKEENLSSGSTVNDDKR